jgi:hypothetical protein
LLILVFSPSSRLEPISIYTLTPLNCGCGRSIVVAGMCNAVVVA